MKNMFKMMWIVLLGVLSGLSAFVILKTTLDAKHGPWYLGCADSGGQEYLIKVDEKPYIREGFIVIGKDTFIAPIQGMTCKIITENDLNAKVKLKDTSNSVI